MQQNLLASQRFLQAQSAKNVKGKVRLNVRDAREQERTKRMAIYLRDGSASTVKDLGSKSCPVCGKGGLTPEQRGER
ncbi:uncharacterized protein [Primulina huaijiensis]|uniref:uncharacterized protein n=1 Tax=Primulina huaijiensis TaxID=1492673 RepID=UPI003CC76D84